MRVIDYPSYLQLRDNAEVLEADGHGDKVLRLRDGSFLKLFRRKRLISSAALFPMRSASPATPANWRGAASFARRCWTYCGSHISSATRCTTSRYRGRPSANSTATTRSAATQSGRNWAS